MKILTDLDQLQLDRIEQKLDQLLAKKKRKPQQSRVEYPEWFEAMWAEYPKRSGNNPKNKAFSAVKARLQEGPECIAVVHRELTQRMTEGVTRYAAYCDATGATGTGLVMHGATFFGPSDPPNYTLDWSIPTKSTLPSNDEELQAWASKNGHRQAHPGESYKAYRAYLEAES